MPIAILVGLMVLPIVLLFLLRVNASLVFLSLCLGDVLVQFVSKDVVSIISGASLNVHTTDSAIKLALLLAPAALTTLFMIRTVSGHKKFINLLPAAGTGLLTALLVVPLLSPAVSANIINSSLWQSMQSLQSSIVAASTLICLLFLWLQRPKHSSEKGGKHHKG